MADLKAVATRVFEKDGVVCFIFPSGTFDVLCAGAGGDPGEAIDFRRAFRPKRDPVLISVVLHK